MKDNNEGTELKAVEISIIMGVYNPSNTMQLLESVQSMVAQSFTNWELLVFNDGSSEVCSQIIEKSCLIDGRIVYFGHKKNCGLAFALNQCIERAKGKYIARMDADDVSKPERLMRLYRFLEHHRQFGWVGSNAELIDENGIWGTEVVPEMPVSNDFLKYSPYVHPSVMFRKEILTEAGGYRVSKLTERCEDYELFMRLHKMGFYGYNIQENLLQYREDNTHYKKRKFKYCFREMQIRFRWFRELGILHASTLIYVIKPVLVGLIPSVFRRANRRRRCVRQAESKN